MMTLRSLVAPILLVFPLVLGGCDNAPPDASGESDSPTVTGPGSETTLDNGLRYRELRAGDGRKPGTEDIITVHYRAFQEDGTLIGGSAQDQPPTFRMADIMPGWREALTRMREGTVWRVQIPADLAYGEEGFGDVIGPGEEVGFELALLRVETEEEWEARRDAAIAAEREFREANEEFLEENAARSGVVMTESGLQYEILSEGGGPKPTPEDTVRVHYTGTLIDGTEFDSSHQRGKAAEFPVNRVIEGWQEALPLMNEGSIYRLVIPAPLAYGDRGSGKKIKPGATLVFEVELLRVLNGDS